MPECIGRIKENLVEGKFFRLAVRVYDSGKFFGCCEDEVLPEHMRIVDGPEAASKKKYPDRRIDRGK